MNHLLSWIIWLPILGMVAIAFVPRDKSEVIKKIAAVFSGLQLLLAIYLWRIFDASNGTFQFMERAEWIPSFNITYILGVDGLSLPMVFLMALIGFIGVFVSWNIDKAVKGYFSLFLLLNTGVMGVFLSLDFFLFYILEETRCRMKQSSNELIIFFSISYPIRDNPFIVGTGLSVINFPFIFSIN